MTTARSKLNPQHDLYEGEPHTSLHALTSQVAQETHFYIYVVNVGYYGQTQVYL